MKIGIDIRTLMDKQYSGVSEYTYNLVKEILRLNAVNNRHEITLYYNSGKDISARIPQFAEYEPNVKIVYTRYPNKIFNYMMQKTLCYPQIDRLIGVDLFFMPHINFISLSQSVKKIITVHDISFMRYREFYSWRKNVWHWLINTKKLLRDFSKIIAVSENTKRDLIELCNVPEEKISVIYSGIDEKYKPITDKNLLDKVKAKYKLPEKFILYLGTLEPRKNISGIIKAYEKFCAENNCGHGLVLAGARGWKAGNIFSAISASPLKDRIIVLGYVDPEDKAPLYNLAWIFIYPSFYEGFGFPPLEALACGTPIIVSHNSSLPEIIGRYALMVNPYNISEITNSLTIALKDDLLGQKIRENTLKIAEKFNWRNVASAYLNIFNDLY